MVFLGSGINLVYTQRHLCTMAMWPTNVAFMSARGVTITVHDNSSLALLRDFGFGPICPMHALTGVRIFYMQRTYQSQVSIYVFGVRRVVFNMILKP